MRFPNWQRIFQETSSASVTALAMSRVRILVLDQEKKLRGDFRPEVESSVEASVADTTPLMTRSKSVA
jgi:hypothetical protein